MTPTARPRHRLAHGAVLLALALTTLAACSDSKDAASGTDEVGAQLPENYVALGDSFTAAPFVPNSDDARGCFRSTNNYPALIGRALPETEVTDVSCSGADTTHMASRQRTATGDRVPPQLKALDSETDLVTLGIGGNDFNVYGTLISRCPQLVSRDPKGSPCREEMTNDGADTLLADIERTGDRLVAVLDEIKQRSPRARILLLNYPMLSTADNRCDDLPLARGDYRYTFEVATALDNTLRAAAEEADVELVDLWTASKGHDVCSDDPWVNGQQTDFSQALAYHPFAVGQEAAADLLLEALDVS